MTKYREIIRLHSLDFSERNIVLSCSVSRNTVSKVLKKADEMNISWPLDETMTPWKIFSFQSNLEQRMSELETATKRISTKAVQIDKFVRLVKKYRDFEELTTPMLNDFIEKVVIHEAEGGRTKDRTQQVDIYFNFIGNFVLPLSEDEYKAILEKGRQNNRKRAEKMRELRMSDPEYRAKMEEKERLALEREKKRQERATKKKKIALAELKEQAEKRQSGSRQRD